MVGTNLGVQSVRTLAKLSSPAQCLARLFPNEDLAGDNPLGQCQHEQQNSFTAALDLPSAPGAQGAEWMIQWLEIKGERCVRC